jgi:peptide/nickel transport system permease protein
MQKYIIKRLAAMVVNLAIIMVLIFMALQIVPGDAAASILGQDTTPEQVEAFRAKHGLDRPVHEQFLSWAGGILTGDMGKSFRSGIDVSAEFKRRLPVTMEIVVLGFVFTTVMGLSFGVISALRQNSTADYSVRVFAVLGLSIPNFFLITLLLIIPAKLWGYAPPFGSVSFLGDPVANLKLFVPPVFLVAVASAATVMRLTRSAFLEVMRQDYVRTAYAKGLNERTVIIRHQMKNALGPVITLSGVQVANLMSGTVIVEQIMGIPGLGRWSLEAIQGGDYPVVMAFVLYVAVVVMFINLIIDLAYGLLDPRIRYG